MNPRSLLVALVALVLIIAVVCAASETTWSARTNSPDSVREITGLPSIALGNLSPAARNPGLEVLCTSFYDTPGGYCFYFTDGVPYINFTKVQISVEGP